MSPQKAWKQRPNGSSHTPTLAAFPPDSYADAADASPSRDAPSIFDRIGPQAPPRRSLLERIELDSPTDVVMGGEVIDQDTTGYDSVRDNQMVADMHETGTRLPFKNHARAPDAYRLTKPSLQRVNNENSGIVPTLASEQRATSPPLAQNESSNEQRLPLQARLGRALKSAVLLNAKLRDKNGTIDTERIQAKIDSLLTLTNVEPFEAKLRKVQDEMDAKRPPPRVSVDQLLNGFENKSANADGTTWSSRRDESHSLKPSIASTSSLPTPPPSELENMNRPPPKAPRAMIGLYTSPPRTPSTKGKEKALDIPQAGENDSAARQRERSHSYSSVKPLHNGGSPRSAAPRRASPSRSPSPASMRGRNLTGEMPRYRSASRSRIPYSPPPRRRSLSRGSVQTGPQYSPPSPRNGNRFGTPPPRAVSQTRRNDSRRWRSASRSPPRSVYPNGFHSHNSRSRSRSRPREPPRARNLSGHPPRYPSRSPSPGFSLRYAQRRSTSRGPFTRKRKPSDRSPPSPHRNHPPHAWSSNPGGPARNPNAGELISSVGHREDSQHPKLVSPFVPKPPREWVPDVSPAPAPPPSQPTNPCDKVPGLWLVKVGAESPRVLEGRFVVEPGFAAIYDLASPRPPSSQPNSKICVSLLCLSTEAVSDLYNSLSAYGPSSPEKMATAVAGLETSWPQDGTLFLDINDTDNDGAGGGRTWLPYDLDPTLPLDVTRYIRPGQNVIRFIQLAGMVHRTFILCASRPEPSSAQAEVYLLFDRDSPTHDKLLKIDATVTIS